MIMGNTIVTGSLIVFSDGFVWKILSNEKAYKIWVSAENEDFELYKVRVDDESESLIESLEDLQDTFKQGHYVCIEVGKLPYSIGLNYLRNLQEMSVEAVEYLPGLKECSREEAFDIIQGWAKEFAEEYGNCDFDGSYYDEIDAFIEEKIKNYLKYKDMEDDLITTKEVGDYRIKVYYCCDSECPITNWGLFGSFFFEYSDTHRLHDECNWKTFFYDNKHNLRDVIDAIVMKHIEQKDIVKYLKKGEANGISFTYNRGGNVWELKHKTSPYIGQEFSPGDLKDFDCRGELIEDLDDENLLDIISKYGKDVVAIEWSTRGYNQGDYIKG